MNGPTIKTAPLPHHANPAISRTYRPPQDSLRVEIRLYPCLHVQAMSLGGHGFLHLMVCMPPTPRRWPFLPVAALVELFLSNGTLGTWPKLPKKRRRIGGQNVAGEATYVAYACAFKLVGAGHMYGLHNAEFEPYECTAHGNGDISILIVTTSTITKRTRDNTGFDEIETELRSPVKKYNLSKFLEK